MLTSQDERIYKSALPLLIWTVSSYKAPSSWVRNSHFHRAPFPIGATHQTSTRKLSLFRGILNTSHQQDLFACLTYRKGCIIFYVRNQFCSMVILIRSGLPFFRYEKLSQCSQPPWSLTAAEQMKNNSCYHILILKPA